jgi:hypothetical protein
MVVFSTKGRVTWWRRNDEHLDHIFLEAAQPLSDESRAAQLVGGNVADRGLAPVPWQAWFPHLPPRAGQLHEQVRRFENYDVVMSLLWFEAE